MGGMIGVTCECGFAVERLSVGIGMAGVDRSAVSCRACGEIHTIVTERMFPDPDDDDDEPVRSVADGCPVCGGPVVELTTRRAPCPRCGKRLRVEDVGLWD